jgi:phosphoglycolate phosphatase-like HAD superfamily hydrolase
MTSARETPLVILFDVDGTLVLTGGSGRRAMRRAFAELRGDAAYLESMDFRGMTDQRILREAIEGSGGVATEGLVGELLELYLGYLAEELATSSGYTVMPGVMELVTALEAFAGVALGLGTGNVRRGAELKLAPCGLDRRLGFGGFGCDAVDRADLLRVGFERGAARLGLAYEACERLVVGDTPLDVHAAKAVGARTVAVCTGGHAAEALREAGAEVVVEDLAAGGVLEAVLAS